MTRWTIALVCIASASAHADPERCAAGIAFAGKGDLPRAALYLDGCDTEDAVRARAEVARKLEAGKLSMMSISTSPEGLVGETDALPGEKFTTPATIWAKAGTYKVTVGDITVEKTLEAHSRTTVIINAPAAKKPAKDGKVDFNEDTPEQTAHEGPPAAVKHGTMMPKKYLKPAVTSGPQIDDPLPTRTDDAELRWRLGARVAAGVVDRAHADPQLGFAVAALAARPLDGPAMLVARLDWSHGAVDTIALGAGFGVILLERPSLVLSVDGALRGLVRVQDTLDTMAVSRAGVGGALDVDVAWLRLPIATALRFEQDFTELVPGARNRALLFEIGYDWR